MTQLINVSRIGESSSKSTVVISQSMATYFVQLQSSLSYRLRIVSRFFECGYSDPPFGVTGFSSELNQSKDGSGDSDISFDEDSSL